IELGAINAINLDGGGSSTAIENGSLVNYVSDSCPGSDIESSMSRCERRVTTITCIYDIAEQNDRGTNGKTLTVVFGAITLSFNQPKFCPTADWNPFGITFANETTLGTYPNALFIDTNNTIYTVSRQTKKILIWINNSITPNKIISVNLFDSYSIFVTNNGDIYYDNGNENGRVDKWVSNTNTLVNVMNVDSSCDGLFIDINNNLYCSMSDDNIILKTWSNDSEMISTTAAGTGIPGSASDELDGPLGVFVDLNFDLYVADHRNDRIQLFKHGELNGTTIVGQGSTTNNISLDFPTAIVLDADKYLYIVDRNNHRIVRSGPNDIRCIIGCDGEGSQSYQLSQPTTLSFDSYGNIFITDYENHRIQKFDFLLNSCDTSSVVQSVVYSSVLTTDNQMYSPRCDRLNYYYETIQISVLTDGFYMIASNGSVPTYGYIYKDSFDPFNPSMNLIPWSWESCSYTTFRLEVDLLVNVKYILVMTTYYPDETGSFSVIIPGLINPDKCLIGGSCNIQTKGIGITLDDILRYEINRNVILKNQPLLVKISVALTIIMFIMGLINSILSFLTFQNANLRKVGCGTYLLASSITSLLTITMFTINFWFILLTQMDSSINLSVRRGGCKSIEPLLKIFLSFDTWLNACVAIERATHVYQGVNFNKEKSKRFARWIIFISPLCISATMIHEPLYRNVFEHPIKDVTDKTKIIGRNIWCIINYSRAVQDYNTVILFIHLIGPFIANLFSALFIIFGTARQRSAAQTNQNYMAHIREQFREHKRLVISPAILLILSMPRLIISLVSGCVKVSDKPWLYLCAYFISFTPSILVFVVFVIPSELYLKTLKESLRNWQRRIRR
ncbi:unnamed protein product, partial [Adineta steineri]